MSLNKQLVSILMLMLVLPTLFSGCIEGDKQTGQYVSSSSNSAPIPIVNAPETSYFGEAIEFDGSGSYDSDGTIIEIVNDTAAANYFDARGGGLPGQNWLPQSYKWQDKTPDVENCF